MARSLFSENDRRPKTLLALLCEGSSHEWQETFEKIVLDTPFEASLHEWHVMFGKKYFWPSHSLARHVWKRLTNPSPLRVMPAPLHVIPVDIFLAEWSKGAIGQNTMLIRTVGSTRRSWLLLWLFLQTFAITSQPSNEAFRLLASFP